MLSLTKKIDAAVKSIRKIDSREVDCAIILGSGLGNIAPTLIRQKNIDYQDIQNLNPTSVQSHKGLLTIGEINHKCVAICQGRHHLYEGYTPQEVVLLVYVLAALGVKQLIITNAAGALVSNLNVGDVMIIEDHINFTGQNPILGQNDNLEKRFVDMSQAYNKTLIKEAKNICNKHSLSHDSGIYVGVLGPSLETSSERRMLKTLGGSAVGMSTVLEVIAANHCEMQVLGLSAITNMALGDKNQQVDTIEEVLKNSAIAGKKMGRIINALLTT